MVYVCFYFRGLLAPGAVVCPSVSGYAIEAVNLTVTYLGARACP